MCACMQIPSFRDNQLACSVFGYRCGLRLKQGIFRVQSLAFDINRWFHMVFVFHGPNNGEGITVHLNSESVTASSKAANNIFPNDATGEVAIGRLYMDLDQQYGNVMANELTFWNRQLSKTEVEALRNKYRI